MVHLIHTWNGSLKSFTEHLNCTYRVSPPHPHFSEWALCIQAGIHARCVQASIFWRSMSGCVCGEHYTELFTLFHCSYLKPVWISVQTGPQFYHTCVIWIPVIMQNHWRLLFQRYRTCSTAHFECTWSIHLCHSQN